MCEVVGQQPALPSVLLGRVWPAAVAAAVVSGTPFDFTLGDAAVAAAHPVAPIAVRAMTAASDVPFVEYAM